VAATPVYKDRKIRSVAFVPTKMTIMTTSEEEERIPKLVPTSTSSVSKAGTKVLVCDANKLSLQRPECRWFRSGENTFR